MAEPSVRWHRGRIYFSTWVRHMVLAVVAAAFLFAAPAAIRAGDMTPAEVKLTGKPSALDGQVFTGEFGALGKSAINTDTWVFENGTFMSMQCEKCGFPRGLVVAKPDGGKISFVAETPCPLTDARIEWRGTVENGEIEGVWTWTRKRWYRTIVKKFWFKGSLSALQQTAVEN